MYIYTVPRGGGGGGGGVVVLLRRYYLNSDSTAAAFSTPFIFCLQTHLERKASSKFLSWKVGIL
jgi:hypothetical protein